MEKYSNMDDMFKCILKYRQACYIYFVFSGYRNRDRQTHSQKKSRYKKKFLDILVFSKHE